MCTNGVCTCALTCGTQCVDPNSDANNCGGCGKQCGTGQGCIGGTCGTCPSGQTLCAGICTNTSADPTNCGACGVTCAVGGTCQTGTCVDSCVDEDSDAGCKASCLVQSPPGDLFCGYGADGGQLTCTTGQQCCLGGSIGGGAYDPEQCGTWSATGTGCSNPPDGGIGIACQQISDCKANGVADATACCLQGASVAQLTGCASFKATHGTGIVCESSGTGSVSPCKAGEVQVCASQADCPTSTTCKPGRWELFEVGFCL